ncbi:MAG TPA: HD domain-containing phosphohydrolase [Gemmatimonadaceae bacterium]|nr:HD domain-containing phosphohydrolase [Gemmatimonadaceae bacterium]
MKPLLIASVGRAFPDAPFGRRDGDIEVQRLLAFPEAVALDPTRPTVVLLDRFMLFTVGDDQDRLQSVAEVAALIGVGDETEAELPADFPAHLLTGYISSGSPVSMLLTQIRGAFRHAAALVTARAARGAEEQRQVDLGELVRVSVALSTERNLTALLEMILTEARRVTVSDAGSVYLCERGEDEAPRTLRFKLAQNDSLSRLEFEEFTVPIDNSSLAGHAALTGHPLAIADVYTLPADAEYQQNRSFDQRTGYRTKSMLVLPLLTQRGDVVGVLQLINRKRSATLRLTSPKQFEHEVLSYDRRCVQLVSALASQAAVSIENSMLYEDIERLFEGFVTASVTAIESRDPTTSGHSGRVAAMTVRLAESLSRASSPLRNVRFTPEQLRELRYACLLHDFGKVGVREQVLVKAKKLYPSDLDAIHHRFAYLRQAAELEFERRRADYLLRHGRNGYEEACSALTSILEARHQELGRYLDMIMTANEPSIVPEAQQDLRELTEQMYLDFDGTLQPLLSNEELQLLTIPKGTLDAEERREIESHVTHTFRFLQQIPWTRGLRGIPDIAFAHHEKMNGRGYPRGICGQEIPVQARMMTIADIYDALTAADRPYKRAVSVESALDILRNETREGLLDGNLLDVFIGARIFESQPRA